MMKRAKRLAGLLLICCALTVPVAEAQGPKVEAFIEQLQTPPGDMQNARNTAFQLQQMLRQYPPFLRELLRLDPSLLTNEPFLAPYPNLKEFIAKHPEIVRSPGFFVGEVQNIDVGFRPNGGRSTASRMFEDIMTGFFVFTMFVTIATFLGTLIKMVIDHRRWLRVSKVQSEVHAKLLDRFAASQDLLAYIQTPAGRHFLESAPIVTDAGSRPISAPVNRILWSVQVGVVLALAGIGLNYVSGAVIEDIAQPLTVIGVLALALGIGFVLSALVAYVLSRRLGLIDQTPGTPPIANPGATPPHA